MIEVQYFIKKPGFLEVSRAVVWNRSYLEIGIFKQSHFFTVHQKHNTLSSHKYLNYNTSAFLVMIFQRSVVLLSDSPCITKHTLCLLRALQHLKQYWTIFLLIPNFQILKFELLLMKIWAKDGLQCLFWYFAQYQSQNVVQGVSIIMHKINHEQNPDNNSTSNITIPLKSDYFWIQRFFGICWYQTFKY